MSKKQHFINTSWFLPNGMMSPYGENGVLFTSYYCILAGVRDNTLKLAKIALEKVFYDDHFDSGEKNFSHDNLTGVFCMSKTMGYDLHTRIWWKNWWAYLHPEDLIWYLWANRRWYSLLVYPLLWIVSLSMMHSCWSDWKVGKDYKVLKTDGKLLTWARLKSFPMPITARVCTWIIKNNKEFGSWKNCFRIYFKEEKHPNRNFPDSNYDLY